jgi:hypothetical protein
MHTGNVRICAILSIFKTIMRLRHIYKDSGYPLQTTRSASIRKINQLMLHGKAIAFYCIVMARINTFCGQTADYLLLHVAVNVGTRNYHWPSKN